MKSNTPAGATILALVILSLLLTISTPFAHRILLFKLFCTHRAVWHEQQWATIALARLACKSAAKNWDMFIAYKKPVSMQFNPIKTLFKSQFVVEISPQSKDFEVKASVISTSHTTKATAFLTKTDKEIHISLWQTTTMST